jgi:hypothetical protein
MLFVLVKAVYLVERWLRVLADKALRRASFNSVPDLISSIEQYPGRAQRQPEAAHLDRHS